MRKSSLGCALTVVVVLVVLLGGCDGGDVLDLVAQSTQYTSLVSVGMQVRGWSGFPSTPLALLDYVKDLKESIADARDGVLDDEGRGGEEGDGWDGGDVELKGLGEAFGVVGR